MPLADLNLPAGTADLPRDVRLFLREAGRRVERFQRSGRVPAFVPSDFEGAYGMLHALAAADLVPGRLFCEWGSGFGVVACLAALLEFDACGIEIEPELVDAAQRLAEDFGLPVEFACGSFLPERSPARARAGEGFAWLTVDGDDAHTDLDLAPDDFDVIFAYPWPDEEKLTANAFECQAATGAVLVTYHGGEAFRVRQKRRGRQRRRVA